MLHTPRRLATAYQPNEELCQQPLWRTSRFHVIDVHGMVNGCFYVETEYSSAALRAPGQLVLV